MVVRSALGHLAVNAAAGTGKTTTIAARILYLQTELDWSPSWIMALSFSRAARAQISDHLDTWCRLVGSGSPVQSLTFHGLAYRVVRLGAEVGESFLRPGFQIVNDTVDGLNKITQNGMQSLLRLLNKPEELPLYFRALNIARQEGYLRPGDIPPDHECEIPGEFQSRRRVLTNSLRRIWENYERLALRENKIDYTGLVTEALRILNKEGHTLQRTQSGIKCLVVDEFQDTSRTMMDLMFKIADSKAFLNVVGDDDQAIYCFNGSCPENLSQFEARARATGLPVLESVNLTENYRSTQNILAVANRILGKSKRLTSKELTASRVAPEESIRTYRAPNPLVRVVRAPRLDLAADFIANEIANLMGQQDLKASEIAVLVRKDTEYSPQGAAVRNALTTMGIPVASMVRCCEAENRARVLEVVLNLLNLHYSDMLNTLVSMVAAGQCDHELNGISRNDILEVLVDARAKGVEKVWQGLDYLVDCTSIEDQPTATDGVQVRTIHSAKGAEFRVVFLTYLGDTQFPHGKHPDVDEERRLLYVGITRAQERLYIVGEYGTRSASFLQDCEGPSAEKVKWLVQDGKVAETPEKYSERTQQDVEEIGKRLAEEEESVRRGADLLDDHE